MNDDIVTRLLNRQHSSSTTQVSGTTSYPTLRQDGSSIRYQMQSSNEDLVHTDKDSTDKLPFFVTDRKSQIASNLSRYAHLNNKTNRPGTPDSSNSSLNDISFNLNLKLGKLKSNTNKANTGIGRDYWLDDSSAIKCRACDKKFTTFLRRHHCRICGKIFCSNCTTFIDGTKFSYPGNMRVCLQCNNLADRYNDDMFSSDDDDYIVDQEGHISGDSDDSGKDDEPTTSTDISGVLRASMPYVSRRKTEKHPSQPTSSSEPNSAIEGTHVNPTPSSDNNDDDGHDDEDENQMISFMNNHEFSWPNSGNSAITENSTSRNRFISPDNNTPIFLKRADSFKPKTKLPLYPTNSFNKSARRRVASNRIKNRKVSSNFRSSLSAGMPESYAGGQSNIQFYDEFQRVGEKYAACLLKEMLVDKGISNVESWTTVLIDSLKHINSTEIELHSASDNYVNSNESNYNFSNYIKIKKIQGETSRKSKTVEGIVFSKKLPLKTMPSQLENPKIMLITFPIEYDQDKDNKLHFQSLEAVIAQQDEYIKKLVDRILNSKPGVIVSTKSVNGLALKLFADKSIAVLPECKLSNLIKLSKFTDSTIITSIDILAMKPKLGTCGLFSSLSFRHENIVKSYISFDKCPNKIGLTIILRDPSEEILSKIKSCLTIMMYVFANLKLESSFLRDQCLKLQDSSEIEFVDLKDMVSLYSYDFEDYTDFIKLVNLRLLSISPWVKFDVPLVLKQLEYIKGQRNDNEQLFQRFLSASSEERIALEEKFGIENLQTDDESELLELVKAINRYVESCLKVENLFYMRKWEQFWRSRELTYFDPNYNQNIVVLFSQISKKNLAPCIGPEIQLIDFYWQSDFSLGQFIEHMCLNADSICGENCHLPIKDHYRSYAHNDGKVDVYIEPNDLNTSSDCIMTWSVCKKCQNSTAILPLNNTSFKYSFGKYLELICWFNHSYSLKVLNSKNTCQCGNEIKDYDFFKECHHYFSFRDYRVHFQYSRIDNLKLSVPKSELFWNPVYEFKNKKSNFDSIKEKNDKFFDSVRDRLARIKLDGTNLLPEDVEQGEKKLEELKLKTTTQKNEIDLLLVTMKKKSATDNTLKLNVVLREIQELSSFWNAEFQMFAKTFLPSEKDIKKITAFQLDRLFKSLVGKDEDYDESSDEDNEVQDSNEKSTTSPTGEIRGLGSSKSAPVLSESGNMQGESSSWGKSDSLGPPRLPNRHKSQIILNKINELNNQKKDGLLSIESGRPYDNNWDEGKVKQLTNFFNTQEYFNQRQLEKEKIDKFNKYTPKVSSMKPKIEIYKNASDAVNEYSLSKTVNDSTPINNVDVADVGEVGTIEKGTEKEKPKENKTKEKNKEVPSEKVSLLKSLTHFWADRSATLWEPLSYPLSSSEHIFVDSDVIVREDEPSSIIAFCLSTSDYESKLNGNTAEKVDADVNDRDPNLNKEKGAVAKDAELENVMLKKGFHLKYQFEDGDSTFLCKIFFTQQFDALRKKCGVNENFIESLSRCIKWDSSGGKSGSAFLKTQDQRFIIKELSKAELEAFVHFAPSYFEYFAHVLFHDLPSVLVKIFGFYQIQVKNNLPNSKSYTMDILIMENLFYDRKIDRIFDLKGSMRNRHVEQTGKENEVLLDENMVEYIYESPLFVKENDKRLLRASLWNDTLFLEKMNVMDYSLVVGIDLAKDELIVGIIDCIRTFTWDKKLESWVKEKGLVGNSGVGKEPTVITPKLYKNRFREAMERYILMSPGAYYQGTTNTNNAR